MSWAISIIEAYIIGILIMIHLSLLFCKSDHCVFDASPILKTIPLSIVNIITKMLQIIPVSIPNLQLFAHFLLIGDVLILIGVVFKFVGSIFRYVIGTILLTVFISFVIYLITNMNDQVYLENFKNKAKEIISKLTSGGDL